MNQSVAGSICTLGIIYTGPVDRGQGRGTCPPSPPPVHQHCVYDTERTYTARNRLLHFFRQMAECVLSVRSILVTVFLASYISYRDWF